MRPVSGVVASGGAPVSGAAASGLAAISDAAATGVPLFLTWFPLFLARLLLVRPLFLTRPILVLGGGVAPLPDLAASAETASPETGVTPKYFSFLTTWEVHRIQKSGSREFMAP